MDLKKELREGLGVALNEATMVDLEMDPIRRIAGATFRVLSLPEGDETVTPEDTRVQLVFQPIGRVAVSLRLGHWDDPAAPVERLRIDQLSERVKSFGGLPIYGWEFFDLPDTQFAQWSNRLSLDLQWPEEGDGFAHTVDLFQEADSILDMRLWFDELTIRDARHNEVPLEDIIAGGRRWWDAFWQGDPRTRDSGMHPIKEG